jgi:nicotinamidase-related amidase
MPTPAILERDRIGLLVVDLQERFRDLIDGMPAVVAASSRLIRYCQRLDIPVRVTEQYPRGLGHTMPEVAALFEGGDAPAEKLRPQWIVCGIETHVCVYQTVRDLLAEGKQVAVAVDAVSSCNASDREIGLGYMRDLGAQLMSTQMIMFEILRDAGTPEFKSVADILKE